MTQHILIENGSVIDGTGAQPRPESVLIADKMIVAVGAAADARATELNGSLERIDATGLTVMPGLIDAHCHVTFDEPATNDELFYHRRSGLGAMVAAHNVRKLLLAGVTGFFDPDSIFELGLDLRDAIEAGVVEGPRMTTGVYALVTSVGGTAGRLFPDEGVIGYAKIVPTRDDIVREVRRQIKLGADWIKVHITGLVPRQKQKGEIMAWSFDELRAVCDTAHALGVPVTGHCRGADSTRDAARAGVDMIMHATFMDEEAFEAVAERRVALVPSFTFQANLADYGDHINADRALQDIFRREIESSAEMLQRCHKAGVPLLCGSESGFSLTPYGEWHHRELEVFVRDIGLTPLEAIQCATEAGAKCLRLEDKVGTVAPGRFADLIGLEGDPSKDVTVLGDKHRFRFVMVGGRRVDLSRRQPDRRPIPGWRVNQYGKTLTQALVRGSNQ